MYLKKYIFTLLITVFFIKSVFGKEHVLKWFNNAQVIDSIVFIDISKYQLTLAKVSWGDNKRNYRFLKCLATIKVDSGGKINLKFFCDGFDHLENKFSIKLFRESGYEAGIGAAVYRYGIGRCKSFLSREWKDSKKCIDEVTKGFYRHTS